MNSHLRFVSFSLSLLGLLLGSTGSATSIYSARTALNSPEDQVCRSTFERLYGKGSAQFRVIFGYKDSRPARFVGDRHEKLAFFTQLLKPCSGGEQSCGFTRDPDNADLFTKHIIGPGQQPVKIELIVVNSSVASDDVANRIDPFQRWQSNYAKRTFNGGIAKADVVFYNGHSRFGGGPDFEPPILDSKGEPDTEYYKAQRPGFQLVLEKLNQRVQTSSKSTGLVALGLFSCSATQHFAKTINKDFNIGLISTSAIIHYSDALESSLKALSALLEMRCPSDFKAAIGHSSPAKGAQVYNLFSNH